jgi:hypothetical protein
VAEIRVIYKRRSVWPWMLGLVMVALVIWMVSQAVARADASRGNAARMEKSHTVTVSTARPGKRPAATTPTPAPRPATEQEEALRLRSRIMA